MTDKVLLSVLAILALVSLFVAPWAAISRETGARGTVLVLPNRIYDFTGRTDPVQVPGQSVVLGVAALALAAVAHVGRVGARALARQQGDGHAGGDQREDQRQEPGPCRAVLHG